MMEKISVIVPFYNGSIPLLQRALKSVENMRYSNIEVVLVDDGSEGGIDLKSVVDNFDLGYEVKILRHSNNKGIATARNTAVENATGEWLIWLDCDDWLDAACIIKMQPYMREKTMIIGECYVYEGESISLRQPKIFFDLASKFIKTMYDPFAVNVFSIQPQLVKKDAVVKLNMFNPIYRFSEMTEFFLRFVTHYGIDEIASISGAYYHYNRNLPNSVSQNRTQLEKYRLKALREYAIANELPVDDIVYLGRNSNLGTQTYASQKDEHILLPPYTQLYLTTQNILEGE